MPEDSANRRDGHYSKTVHSDEDTLDLQIPSDRDNNFEPQLVPKGVRRFDGFDDKII